MKKSIFLGVILVLGSVLIFPNKAFAGAWTLPQNNIWMEFFFKYSFANDWYNNHWKSRPMGWDDANLINGQPVNKGAEWWAYDYEFKFEYGLADWLNFLYAISYEVAVYKEYSRPRIWGEYVEKTYGWKYQMIGTKIRLQENPYVVSVQLRYFMPGEGYKIRNSTYGRDIRETDATVDRGDYKLEVRGLIGKNFKLWTLPCYAGFESGIRFRSDESANDIPVFFESGFSPLRWLIIKGELDSFFSVENTGEDREDYVIARGGVTIVPTGAFGQYRKDPTYNVEVLGGKVIFGRNTNDAWEVVVKFSTQFDVPHMVESLTLSRHKSTKEVSHPTR